VSFEWSAALPSAVALLGSIASLGFRPLLRSKVKDDLGPGFVRAELVADWWADTLNSVGTAAAGIAAALLTTGWWQLGMSVLAALGGALVIYMVGMAKPQTYQTKMRVVYRTRVVKAHSKSQDPPDHPQLSQVFFFGGIVNVVTGLVAGLTAGNTEAAAATAFNALPM
jgi:hypothetical protein